MVKFKNNDKVIAISKSYGEDFENSGTIRDMKRLGQNYIYVKGTDGVHQDQVIYICDAYKNNSGSGYFLEKDLTHYHVSIEELNKQLLNGQIDVTTYQTRKKDVK